MSYSLFLVPIGHLLLAFSETRSLVILVEFFANAD